VDIEIPGARKALLQSTGSRALLGSILLFALALCIGAFVQWYGVFGSPFAVLESRKDAEASDPEQTENQVSEEPEILEVKAGTAAPEYISIDIKFKDYRKLQYKKEVAAASSIMITSAEDYVPAKITHKKKTVRVKIRLKGDWTRDHINEDKWSFRIKVRGDNTLFGMRVFSLHHPKARRYVNEWVFHNALKREGVLSLRYDFINVSLNGKDLGLYAIEEHFDKQLLEYNRRREGPILKQCEDVLWKDRKNLLPYFVYNPSGLQSALVSDIGVFNEKSTLRNPKLRRQVMAGRNLLKSFMDGKTSPEKVFDLDNVARFFAVCEVFGATHAYIWHNLRYYMNPVTSKMEMIGFDANAGLPLKEILGAKSGHLVGKQEKGPLVAFFSNESFFRKYIENLERISKREYLDKFFAEIDGGLREKLGIIATEFPKRGFSKTVYYKNADYIRRLLAPVKAVHAMFSAREGDRIEMSISNLLRLPIEIVQLSCNGSVIPVSEKTVLPGCKTRSTPEFIEVCFQAPAGVEYTEDMARHGKVSCRILGSDARREDEVLPWEPFRDDYLNEDFHLQEPNFKEFEFLKVDDDRKTVTFIPGEIDINRDIVIPKGYRVICTEGTEIRLLNAAVVLSYSPLEFRGSEEYPVKVTSPNGTGQGIAVLEAGDDSTLEHVWFSGLSNPSKGSWELTGAVTFYKSPVDIAKCYFGNNVSEDALNIIDTSFNINSTLFDNASSDAFDGDFTVGTISNSSFINCMNDGIDVSGSTVTISQLLIRNAGDKGLSVGENSRMNASNIDVKKCRIAIVAKDESVLMLENSDASDCEIGFAVYQKKPEFGPARISLKNARTQNNVIAYLLEKGSSLTLNDVPLERNTDRLMEMENVFEFLYGKKPDKE
jgi:hypothetical protein